MDGILKTLLDRLIRVIEEEARVFERFMRLLEEQQQCLMASDTGRLSSITVRLQQVLSQSQKLEEERSILVGEIGRHRGNGSDMTVAEICDLADPGQSLQLRELQETMLAQSERIENSRVRNRMLIEQSLEQIHHTVEMLGKVPAAKETYRSKADRYSEPGRLMVDRRA
jgi:hypothetical protein